MKIKVQFAPGKKDRVIEILTNTGFPIDSSGSDHIETRIPRLAENPEAIRAQLLGIGGVTAISPIQYP